MTTRAIHLEIVENLSATELINALRRFIARRGKPQLIISDNATNFALGKDIIETLDQETQAVNEQIRLFMTKESIQWKFITPLSPGKEGFMSE